MMAIDVHEIRIALALVAGVTIFNACALFMIWQELYNWRREKK